MGSSKEWLKGLDNERLTAWLKLEATVADAAVRNYNRIFDIARGPKQRQALLLAMSEQAGAPDIDDTLAAKILALGQIERLGELAAVEGIGPRRLAAMARALAACDPDEIAGGGGGDGGDGGDGDGRIPNFFAAAFKAVDLAEQQFLNAAELQGLPAAIVESTGGLFKGARTELADIQNEVGGNPDSASALQEVLDITGGERLLAAQNATTASAVGTATPSLASKFSANDGVKILTSIVKKLVSKIPGPIGLLAQDLAEILGMVGDKLTQAENPLVKLQKDVDNIEKKVANLTLGVTGNSAYSDPESTMVADPPKDGIAEPKLPGSVLYELVALENKLHVVKRILDGNPDYDVNIDGQILKPGTPAEESVVGEIGKLIFKIDKLADLLGRTLVDANCTWNPEPDAETGTTTDEERAKLNKTPEKAVKEELHEIEDCLQFIKDCVAQLKLLIPGEEPPLKLLVSDDVKRIFVYEEDVFVPQQANDTRTIRIRTPAFDLGGWIDLSDLRDGDQVEVALFVFLPEPRRPSRTVRRLYRRASFGGRADAGLINLHDVTGATWLVGKAIDVRIRQTASLDGFQTKLRVPYQMVVESQALA